MGTPFEKVYSRFLSRTTDFNLAELDDYTLNEMIKYIDDLLKTHNPEENSYYYLYDIFCAKIDGLEFLNDNQKESYKNDIKDAINNSFIPGIKALKEGLETCKGKLDKEDEGYWATYENGADLYQMELENLLGLHLSDVYNMYVR